MPASELCFSAMSTVPPDPTPTNQSLSDVDLLKRYFKDGDRGSMDELFLRHVGMAYRLALANIQNAEDAEEVVQTAFLQVLLKGNQFGDGSTVRGILMRIVIDTCHKRMREDARRKNRQDIV